MLFKDSSIIGMYSIFKNPVVSKLCQTYKNKKAATISNGLTVNVGAEGFEPPTLPLKKRDALNQPS
jgi:hypothetical protein